MSILRYCGAVLVLFVAARIAPAQDGDGQKLPVYKLTLHPAKAAKPALRFRLLPELRDMESGNAVIRYYRSMSPEWMTVLRHKSVSDALNKWVQEDLKTMPPGELKFVRTWGALKEIDLGARRTYCNWDMLRQLRKEGIALVLPDIQNFRYHAFTLSARARFQMADGDHKGALYTLQTGLAFSRHITEGPNLIQSLVGMAVTAYLLNEVEQFVAKKNAPNLYWALTNLPKPFVNIQRSLQGEKILLDHMFPGMRDMLYKGKARPYSEREIDTLMTKMFYLRHQFGMWGFKMREPFAVPEAKEMPLRLTIAVTAARIYPKARRVLLEQGLPPQIVDKMPVIQVALLYEIYLHDFYLDELAKWYGLPYAQMQVGLLKSRQSLQLIRRNPAIIGVMLRGHISSSVEKVLGASYRIERKIAALRCVEAIRMYAAEHGKLPATLRDIKNVPVPRDPLTGEMFPYQRDDTTAKLTAPASQGQSVLYSGADLDAWIYELRLAP